MLNLCSAIPRNVIIACFFRSAASITLDDDEANYGDELESSFDEKQNGGVKIAFDEKQDGGFKMAFNEKQDGGVKMAFDEKNPRRLLGSEELGPVTKRFVIVRRGMDVVLECHDAVGNEDVLWEKQGGNLSCYS